MKNLKEYNKLADRVWGLRKDKKEIESKIESFQTAGKGYYAKNTIDNFFKIKVILMAMVEQIDKEIDSIIVLMKDLKASEKQLDN